MVNKGRPRMTNNQGICAPAAAVGPFFSFWEDRVGGAVLEMIW
jgi:hypothetical protein